MPAYPTNRVTVPAVMAQYLSDSASVWGIQISTEPARQPGMTTVEFDADARARLENLDGNTDGVISDGDMWIGGTDWPLTSGMTREQPATLPDVADPNSRPGSACNCPGYFFAEGATDRRHGRQYLCRNHSGSRYYIARERQL